MVVRYYGGLAERYGAGGCIILEARFQIPKGAVAFDIGRLCCLGHSRRLPKAAGEAAIA